MKKAILLICVLLIFLTSCNQSDKKQTVSTKQEIKENVRYKMFPTENIWTFLKLDTQSGKIWQVQYSIDNSYRGEVVLNDKELVSAEAAENGRFTLYPTNNIYNFILLDQINGKMWQVQWSVEEENRVVISI
jgi:major membrane immunogen (membrane-anchored lipoprotein)